LETRTRWLLLFNTSEEGKGPHSHIAFIKEDGTGITSVDQGHAHEIIFQPPQEPVVDETGQVLSEAAEGFPVLQEADEHSHAITTEFQAVQKDLFVIPTDKEKSLKRSKAIFKEIRSTDKDSIEMGEKAEQYYEGDQWEDSLKSDLKAKNQAALTINEVEGKIDLLSGVQRQNRSDMRFFPDEDGDAVVADILTIVVKHVTSNAKFDIHESKVFEDQAITGRGGIIVDTDFDKDIRGKITTDRFNWSDFGFGPHEQLDAEDSDTMAKWKWLSLSKVKQMFPEKSKDLEANFSVLELKKKADKSTVTDGGITVQQEKDPYGPNPDGKSEPLDVDPEFVDITKRQVRLVETWQKSFARVDIAMSVIDGFFLSLEGVDSKEISRIKTINGLDVIRRIIFRFRTTQFAADTLLSDEFPDLPTIQGIQFYPLTPAYAKKRRNSFWGKVRAAMDLQNEINKRHSQGVDILNKVAPYGWFYDEETFPPGEEEKFRKSAATPGFKQKVTDIQRKPQLQEGVKYPVELANAIALASNKMKEIMNINLELLGQQGKNLSGVAIKENKRSGLLGNDFLFDNLTMMRRSVALKIVANIQMHWDVDRIIRIVGFEAKQNPDETEVQGQPIDPSKLEAYQRILQDQDLTTYDVKVSESASSPTARLGNFLFMKELAGQGVTIAPTTLIRMSDIPDKKKALEELQAFVEQQAAQEDKKLQVELEKTRMAQEGRGGL